MISEYRSGPAENIHTLWKIECSPITCRESYERYALWQNWCFMNRYKSDLALTATSTKRKHCCIAVHDKFHGPSVTQNLICSWNFFQTNFFKQSQCSLWVCKVGIHHSLWQIIRTHCDGDYRVWCRRCWWKLICGTGYYWTFQWNFFTGNIQSMANILNEPSIKFHLKWIFVLIKPNNRNQTKILIAAYFL